MEIADVVSRDVLVTPVEDPRVRFYLENQRLIETWAAIRDEASRELWDRILGLVDVLSEDAELLGETDAVVDVRDADSNYPRIEVVRRRWQPNDALAPVCFMIERQGNLINASGTLNLYAGLRMRRQSLLSETQQAALQDAGAQFRASLGKLWAGGRGRYVAWRWIRPEGEALDEMVVCREARAALWRSWAAAADTVDSLLLV